MKATTWLKNRINSCTRTSHPYGYIDVKDHEGINIKHNELTVHTDYTNTCVDMTKTFDNIDFIYMRPCSALRTFPYNSYNFIIINDDKSYDSFLTKLRLSDLGDVTNLVIINMFINNLTLSKTRLYNIMLIDSYIENIYRTFYLKNVTKSTIVNTEEKYIKKYNSLYSKEHDLHTSKKWQSQN